MATKITRLPARVLVPLGSLGTDDWFMHDGQLYRFYAVNEEAGEITVFAHDENNFYEDAMSPDTMVEPQDVEFIVRPRVMGE